MRLPTIIGYLGHFIQCIDEGSRERRETDLQRVEGLVNICVCDYLDQAGVFAYKLHTLYVQPHLQQRHNINVYFLEQGFQPEGFSWGMLFLKITVMLLNVMKDTLTTEKQLHRTPQHFGGALHI